jgi:hypothetical protein
MLNLNRGACRRIKEALAIREAAFASLKAPTGPAPAAVDPADANEGGVKLRAGDEFFSTIVIKPSLARLEAGDYRVTRSGVMFRCMLI